jgi:hypothetical protein
MTDYVIKKVNENRPCDRGVILQEISDYAEFLKQPLTLGMFIPCDEKGQPLSIHKGEEIDSSYPIEFIQAKERVIFEGFKIKYSIEEDNYYEIELNNDLFLSFYNDTISVDDDGNEFFVYTIEDLIELEFNLTETTAKKLGL